MIVFKQVQKPVEEVVIEKSLVSLSTIEKIDRYGDLKVLMDSMGPTIKEYENLKASLVKELSTEGKDESELTVSGNRYTLVLSPRVKERKITNVHDILTVLGEDTFMEIATVSLSNLDKYVSKKEQEGIVEIKSGNRRVMSVVSI